MVILMWSYFGGNKGAGAVENDLKGIYTDLVGNTFNGSDDDHGYVDSANDDFNIASGATLRSVAIDLDS